MCMQDIAALVSVNGCFVKPPLASLNRRISPALYERGFEVLPERLCGERVRFVIARDHVREGSARLLDAAFDFRRQHRLRAERLRGEFGS